MGEQQEMAVLATGGNLFPAASAPTQPPLTQAETGYVEKTPNATEHCSICKHFLGAGACALVKPEPKAIMDQGWCSRFMNVSVDEMKHDGEAVVKEQAMETRGFIYIKLRWLWDIERIQSAFYTLFGYQLDWDWQSAYTYHITLAHSMDVTDEQMLEAVKAAVSTPAFRIQFTGLGTFPLDETRKTLYVKVEPNDALTALQSAIYDSLIAQGVEVSAFHAPDAFVAHLSIATIPVDFTVPEAVIDFESYCDEVVLARDNYTEIAQINLKWQAEEDGYFTPNEGVSPSLEQAKWEVCGASDLAVGKDSAGAWDAALATKIALESANYGKPDAALEAMRPMFLIADSAAPKLLTSYRHPFAEMVDGKLTVTAESLRAAALSVAADKLLPESVVEQALEVLNAYKQKAGIGEMTRIRMAMISEMKGDYPIIETPADIDLTAIQEITGDKPFFVTLPIGQAGARSNNNRTYSTRAVQDMVEQVNSNRPYGGWGHMTEEQLATMFDPPDVQCVAAVMESDGAAWGKFLALNQETRDYYRMAKATNSKVATSLVGMAEMHNSEVLGLELIRIDIADPARIGVPQTVAHPQIAHEMAGDVFVKTRTAKTSEAQLPATQVQEQTGAAADAASESGEGTSVPVSEETSKDERGKLMDEKQIQELQASENGLKTQVQEQAAELTTLRAEKAQWEKDKPVLVDELNVLLGEFIVAEIDREIAVPSFRGMVKKQVLKAKPQTRDQIKAAVKEFLDDPDNQEAMKTAVVSEMGERQTSSGESLHSKPKLDASKPETLTEMSSFEFNPVDPSSPRPKQVQMQEA